jgi:hypothetical protein
MPGKMIVALAAVAVVSTLFTDLSQGQEATSPPKESGWGYFVLGGGIMDIKALGSRLESKGYPKPSENFISLGGGAHSTFDRLVIDIEGSGFIGGEVSNERYRVSISGGSGVFNIGYIIYSISDLMLYPLLGLGGGGMNLKILERGTTPSFDEVLDSARKRIELSKIGLLINLAFGSDYPLIFEEDERQRSGVLLGFRVGYVLDPIRGDLNMDGVGIFGGPQVGIAAPYIRLLIGIGGISKSALSNLPYSYRKE